MKKIAVAMSGGVDSSLAALLLKNQGYEIIGLTMDFGLTSSTAIKDARRVAKQLRIKHYVVNFRKELEDRVINNFCQEYLRGRTPNPCVICNQHIKFGRLLEKALSLGAQYLATGHYARIKRVNSSKFPPQGMADPPRFVADTDHRLVLKKAKDLKKDQSYFLYRLKQNQLKCIIFPLGNYIKPEVRALARKFGLAVASKSDSQEICFLQGVDYRAFLKKRINPDITPGLVVDKTGKILGEHKGIAFYTIGQRAGLGIACGYPAYITNIDPKNNQITIGNREEACKKEFLVKNLSFILKIPKKKVALKVKIRYNHQEAEASAGPYKKGFRVIFKEPQFAITAGQSAVFYNDDVVIGGGIIDEVLA